VRLLLRRVLCEPLLVLRLQRLELQKKDQQQQEHHHHHAEQQEQQQEVQQKVQFPELQNLDQQQQPV
jgi:hypothetical protein